MSPAAYFTPLRVGVFGVALAIGIALAFTPFSPAEPFPELGVVAERDIVAAEPLSYVSEALTNQAREDARAAVPTQLAFDPDVGPAQIAALRLYLDDVVDARAVQRRPADGQPAAPVSIADSPLSERDEAFLIAIADEPYQSVARESEELLGALLQEPLPEDELPSLRLSLGERLPPGLSLNETTLITALVAAYLQPTLIESALLTTQARDQAAASVGAVTRSVMEGELIVARGAAVDALAVETLSQLPPPAATIGLEPLAGMLLVAAAAAGVFALYLFTWRPPEAASDRRLLLLAVLILVSVAAARAWFEFTLPDGLAESLDLMLPLAAGPILVAALLSTGLGVTTGVLIAVLVSVAAIVLPDYTVPPSGAEALRPLAFFLASSLGGVFAATRAQALAQYGLAGAAAGLTGFLAGAAFWLLDGDRVGDELGWLALASLVTAALVAVITIGSFSLLGALFGITTPMRLLELAQLQRPLLRRLQEEAPGTFHHSLLVAALSEHAAAQIDADPLLARVGAYYHDIGKLLRPEMFIENQDGANPHDSLDPAESARLIIEHVTGGDELARRDRLPPRVRDFITEHHGSRRVAFFYRKAAMTDPRVDPRGFTYPGQPPQSRETAIVMLADSCEAVVRSSGETDAERISQLVDGVFDERLRERQLDHCHLTLSELRQISASFKQTLAGVHHQRIEYPPATEEERRTPPRDETPAAPSSP